jgi:hypothetical protein
MADMHAPLVDMAMPAESTKMESMPQPSQGPRYPYGCCIRLEDDQLKKLGLDGDLPAVGEMVHLCCEAMVTSASMSETAEGGKRCCVELQIRRMGVPGSPDNRAERWYGDHDEPDEDDE